MRLSWVFLLFAQNIIGQPNYCKPNNLNCWPTSSEISTFASSLDGEFLTSNNTEYSQFSYNFKELGIRFQVSPFLRNSNMCILFRNKLNRTHNIFFFNHFLNMIDNFNLQQTYHSHRSRNYNINSIQSI